jgi:hypothetical protein
VNLGRFENVMDVPANCGLDDVVPNQIENPDSKTMPHRVLGRILYPRLQPWQQRRQAKIILSSLGVALVFAAVVAIIILKENSRR